MRRDNLTKRTLTLAAALLSAVILAGCSKVNNAAATVPDTSVSETSGEGIVSTEETTTGEKSTKDGKDSTSSAVNETTTAENTTTETTTSGRDGAGSETDEKTSSETEATVKTPSETTTEARTEKQTETTTQAPTEKVTEEPTETPTEKQTEKQTEPETTTQAPKHEHSYTSKVTKEPTCTGEGVRTYSCSCGNSYTESIPAKGHSFGSYTYNNDATYDADGTETAVCSVCGAKDTRTASGTKLVHTHNYAPAVTKEPNCTEEGVRTYTCSCGNSYTEGIPAKGHSYGEYVYNNDATTSADGTKTATCSVCGATDTVTAEGTKKALPSWYDEHPDKPLNVATGGFDDGSLEMYFTVGAYWTNAADGCWDFDYSASQVFVGKYAEGSVYHGYLE